MTPGHREEQEKKARAAAGPRRRMVSGSDRDAAALRAYVPGGILRRRPALRVWRYALCPSRSVK